jgi:hypothetical protein
MGSIQNMRYQLVSGMDRLLFERMKILPLYLGASSILRTLGQCAAHNSMAFSTGLRTEIPVRRPKAAQGPVRKMKKVKRKVKKQKPAGDRQPQEQSQQQRPAMA